MHYRRFLIYWVSQVISLIGSEMTRFAVTVWVFTQYESASSVAFGTAAMTLCHIFAGPIAGIYVDRWGYKRAIFIAEAGQAIAIGALIAIFHFWSNPHLAVLYGVLCVGTVFDTLHFPALTASVPLLVKQENLARVNGVIAFSQSASVMLGPALGAALGPWIAISGVLKIDFLSFLLSMTALGCMTLPEISPEKALGSAKSSMLSEITATLTYIRKIPGAVELLTIHVVVNFLITASYVLIGPMVLASTKNNTILLGSLMMFGGASQILGSLAAVGIGVQKFLFVHMVGLVCLGVGGPIVIGLSSSPLAWAIGLCLFMGMLPVINSFSRAVWQARIAQEYQGRFFATHRTLSHSMLPLAAAISGFLVDHFFEIHWHRSSGSGSGYRAALIFYGVLISVAGLVGSRSRNIPQLEARI